MEEEAAKTEETISGSEDLTSASKRSAIVSDELTRVSDEKANQERSTCNVCETLEKEKTHLEDKLSLSQSAYNETKKNLESTDLLLAEKINEVDELKLMIIKLQEVKEERRSIGNKSSRK